MQVKSNRKIVCAMLLTTCTVLMTHTVVFSQTVTRIESCATKNRKATAQFFKSYLYCHSKAYSKGVEVDQQCLDAAIAHLLATIIETASICPADSLLFDDLDNCVATMINDISGDNDCAGRSMRIVAKQARNLMRCAASAITTNGALQLCKAKFHDGTVAGLLDTAGGCTSPDILPDLERYCIDRVLTELMPALLPTEGSLPPPEVTVGVTETFVNGNTTYQYEVRNCSGEALVGLEIGYDYYHGITELDVPPFNWTYANGAPATSMFGSTGWTSTAVSQEESPTMAVSWNSSSSASDLPSGGVQSGFTVVVPGTGDPSYSSGHFNAILGDGFQVAGEIAGQVATECPPLETGMSVALTADDPVPPAVSKWSDVGIGYVTGSGDKEWHIGRWDTEYPYDDPFYKPELPGVEPDGLSMVAVTIAVNDGGILNFQYRSESYDTGVWDYFDVYMSPPGEATVTVVDHLSVPGEDYGHYWDSGRVEVSKKLTKPSWRNQTVILFFAVEQDGWGDQSVGEIYNLRFDTCPVSPLTPLSDSVASSLETQAMAGQDPVDLSGLSPDIAAHLTCMQSAITAAGGSSHVTSGYRPAEYQNHLVEVWDKWKRLENLRTPECQDLRTELQNEFSHHFPGRSDRPVPTSNHMSGNAFDLSISGLTDAQIATIAQQCGMHRPLPVRDPHHFNPIPAQN